MAQTQAETPHQRLDAGMQESLLKTLDRIQSSTILVTGDLILDSYIWGNVDRISPEAPVVVVDMTDDSRRLGGAGNVVHNLRSLGAQVAVCGVVGDDSSGRELTDLLDGLDVDTDGVVVTRGRPTTVKTRVIAHAQQVVRVDREDRSPLPATHEEGLSVRFAAKLETSDGVIVSDYAKGVIGDSLCARIAEGYEKGTLGLGSRPLVIDPKKANFSRYSAASVIKPNRKEAEEASGVVIGSREDALLAGERLLKQWNAELILITLGEMGMVLVSPDEKKNFEVDTVAQEVFDVSGAGDTVSAVFGAALAVKASPEEAAILANLAAGIVVAEIGTVAVSMDELRAVVESGGES